MENGIQRGERPVSRASTSVQCEAGAQPQPPQWIAVNVTIIISQTATLPISGNLYKEIRGWITSWLSSGSWRASLLIRSACGRLQSNPASEEAETGLDLQGHARSREKPQRIAGEMAGFVETSSGDSVDVCFILKVFLSSREFSFFLSHGCSFNLKHLEDYVGKTLRNGQLRTKFLRTNWED